MLNYAKDILRADYSLQVAADTERLVREHLSACASGSDGNEYAGEVEITRRPTASGGMRISGQLDRPKHEYSTEDDGAYSYTRWAPK